MATFFKSSSSVCVLIGAYTIGRATYDLASGYINYYQNPPKDLKSIYGPGYVLITGGSDGLGWAYANEFASKGHNIIILAKNREKLQERQKELENTYNIKVETVEFDLVNSDLRKYEELREKLNGYEISIFLNNAACFNEKNLLQLSPKEIKDLIFCNCVSSLLLRKVIEPTLKQKPNKSAIVNIGSQYVDVRSAKTSNVYFATKAFTNTFSRSITSQLFGAKTENITILPGLIRTSMYKKFQKEEEETFFEGLRIESPFYLAKQTVKRLGYGQDEINGSQRQAFMHYLIKFIIGRFYEI